jgi:hypothetical protein
MKVLNGETEQAVYELHSRQQKNKHRQGKQCTGGRRLFKAKPDSIFRERAIIKVINPVSRRHAHIEWSAEQAAFFLYADEGGIRQETK